MIKNYDIEVITEWGKIYSESFKNEWMGIYNDSYNPHVFFHPSLCLAWIETYRKIRDLEPAFCIAKTSNIKVFFPLVIWKQNWKNASRRLLIPLGYSDFDYHDPLVCGNSEDYNQDSFLNSLFDFIKKKLRFDTIIIDGIRTKMSSKYWITDGEISPYFDLGKITDFSELLGSLGTSLRGDIRRQLRRVGEKGHLQLDIINDNTAAMNILPEFIENHTRRWPNSYKAPHLHENIIKYGLESGIVHFSVLRCNNECLSWHLGFISGERFYYYMPVINPAFEKYSPGKIHLFKLNELSANFGLKVFDHLRGEENYKAGWTNNFSQLYKYHYVRCKPISLIRELLCKFKDSLK